MQDKLVKAKYFDKSIYMIYQFTLLYIIYNGVEIMSICLIKPEILKLMSPEAMAVISARHEIRERQN